MVSVYDFKPKFQVLLRPLVARLAGHRVTANQVTVTAMLVSVAVGIVVGLLADRSRWMWWLLPVWLFVRMALNAIDGMLAREHGQASKLGAVLNELGDVIADTGLYLPLALTAAFSLWPLAVFTVLAVMTEMTGVIGVQIGAARHYEGPMGKSDRALLFGILGLLLALGVPAGWWLSLVVWLLALLCLVTVVRRAQAALRELHA